MEITTRHHDERRRHAAAEKLRCLTPEQAGDVAKTFGPVSGTVNSTCEPAEPKTTGRNLKWHLQCKGQLDLDVLGDFNFDSFRRPLHRDRQQQGRDVR